MILTEHNVASSLNCGDPRLHATVLDYSDGIDFLCSPVLFLTHCRSERVKVRIGGHVTILPLDWKIMVGDREHDTCEVITVRDAIEHRHSIVAFNPLRNELPQFLDIRLIGTAQSFTSTKISKRQLLAIPLTIGDRPICIFAAATTPYSIDPIDVADLVS